MVSPSVGQLHMLVGYPELQPSVWQLGSAVAPSWQQDPLTPQVNAWLVAKQKKAETTWAAKIGIDSRAP